MDSPILFATDFSPLSEAALPQAIALARLWERPLRLVHAVEANAPGAPVLGLPENIESRVTSRALELLTERAERVAAEGIEVSHAILRGLAADELIGEIDRVNAAALVIGTHGYGGFKRFLVGSVANRVVRGATCPVLVVPPAEEKPHVLPWKQLLYPADFSPVCDALFGTAVDLAARLDATLEIYHVEIPQDSALVAYGLSDVLLYELTTEREHIEEHLGVLSARSRQAGVTTTTAHDLGRGPGTSITERVAAQGYDLIVIPSHGRRGFQRFVHGSVTEAVVRQSDVPVLVLPSAE